MSANVHDADLGPIRRGVRQRIEQRLGRAWPAGGRLPSVRDLSGQLGVAPGTAHRAVKDMIADGILVARPRLGVFVTERYTDAQLREMFSADREQAPVHVSDIAGKHVELRAHFDSRGRHGDAFVAAMIHTFADEIVRQGAYAHTRPHRTPQEAAAFESGATTSRVIDARNSQADAIVVFNPNSKDQILCNSSQLLTVVCTHAMVHVARTWGYDVVSVDHHLGGEIAGQALRQAGGRRACFVGVRAAGSQQDQHEFHLTSAMRLEGFRAGWADAGPVELIRATHYGMKAGRTALETWRKLAPRPDVVFAASDELAVGFVTAAAEHRLKPGRDFQIIGFDGQQSARDCAGGAITTIEVPVRQMGVRGAQLLADRFDHRDQPVHRLLLGCSLLQGTTTRAPA